MKNRYEVPDYLQMFFSTYLYQQRGLSSNTISAYSYSLLLFLNYYQNSMGIRPDKITFSDINKESVIGFCDWIENTKKCSVSTRNQRLTAIHALFRYIQGETPVHLSLCRDILSIKLKKCKKEPPHYLSVDAIKSILSSPNPNTKEGLRELAVIALLYDSAIRVQELIDLKLGDTFIKTPATVKVLGKGNRTRIVPISKATAKIIKLYIKKYNINDAGEILFFNRSGNTLTRMGVNYILNKHIRLVELENSDLITIKVTPHILRHSKATHLLADGVNLIYIRDLLGHTSITTTEIYATSNPEFLRRAIEKSSILIEDQKISTSKKQELAEFLKSYCI